MSTEKEALLGVWLQFILYLGVSELIHHASSSISFFKLYYYYLRWVYIYHCCFLLYNITSYNY